MLYRDDDKSLNGYIRKLEKRVDTLESGSSNNAAPKIAKCASVADIQDPDKATAKIVARKINELLAALRDADILEK